MMDALHVANGVMSLLCAVMLAWIILHPNIHEGVLVKVGMNLMMFSLLVTAYYTLGDHYEPWHHLWRAGFTLRLGLFIVVCGLVVKAYQAPMRKWGRRMSDWIACRRREGKHRES
jgi:hypothetical protein